MKGAKFNKNLTVTLEEDTHRKIKAISSERGISMMGWLRGIIDEELDSLSFAAKSVIEDSNADQGIKENDHDQKECYSTSNDDLILSELVIKDDEAKEQVDEIPQNT